ncbi:MAG: DUF456 domain-containing protein [Flavobacteriales bacterium]
MDYFWLIFGLILVIIGVAGSLLPGLPGTPFSWLGILVLHFCNEIPFQWTLLIITFLFMALVSVLDYWMPGYGTKKFGGTRYGIWGTNIGLVIGLLAPVPFGVIIGPFLGAFIGELIYNSKEHNRAFKAAIGSFLGFVASTFMKVILSLIYLGIFIQQIWIHRSVWF